MGMEPEEVGMAGEARKTTARRGRGTTRTKKIAVPPEPAIAPTSEVAAPAPEVATIAPQPEVVTPPAPTPTAEAPREWVPIVYEGEGVFADSDAGVFVSGTRTRLRAKIAARLLRFDGFRLAG